MWVSSRRWWGAVVASVVSLAIACDEPPVAPEFSPGDPALAESDDLESGSQIPFAKLHMFFEFNSHDNDLGVQVLLDGEEWKRLAAFDPGKRKILEILANGRLRQLGLTELFFESAEPSPAEVLALFPAGNYRFVGRTLGNERLTGSAMLSHDLPPASEILSPSDGEEVDPNNVVIRWSPVAAIAGFQLIVANEALGSTLTVDLAPSITSLQVPPVFMQSGTDYKVEVLAIKANGNKTITERTFKTE